MSHFDNNQHKVLSDVVRTWTFGVCLFVCFSHSLCIEKFACFFFFPDTRDLYLPLLYCSLFSCPCSLSEKHIINK